MAGESNAFCVSSWHRPAFDEYNIRTKGDIKLLNFLQSTADFFKLSMIKNILSIGPGTGLIDVALISSCCPNVTHFIGVDPNRDETKELEKRMENEMKKANLKIKIVHDLIERWSGPDEQVDLILLVHVLYHIPDRKSLFVRLRQWLAPGGNIIIVHGTERSFSYVAEKFDVKAEKYIARHIYSDLREVGFENVKEQFFPLQFDIRDRNTNLMNLMLQREASKSELAALDAFLTEILPTGIEDQQISVISWTKPLH